MVVGDKRPHLVGLVVPDPEWAKEWADGCAKPFDIDALKRDPSFRAAVGTAVDRVNRDLSVIEKVRRFAFADEPFSTDNGEMTPSLKIKRHVLRDRYGERLDALYKASGSSQARTE